MGALGRDLPNGRNINLNPNANTATSGNPNGVITSVITVYDPTGMGPLPNGTTFYVPVYSNGASTTSNLINPNFGAVNELSATQLQLQRPGGRGQELGKKYSVRCELHLVARAGLPQNATAPLWQRL